MPKQKTNLSVAWTRCPQCQAEAYVGKEDGSTLLFCTQCGYKAHITLANLLYRKTRQGDYALIMPKSQ